jgi:hypothetical protein
VVATQDVLVAVIAVDERPDRASVSTSHEVEFLAEGFKEAAGAIAEAQLAFGLRWLVMSGYAASKSASVMR